MVQFSTPDFSLTCSQCQSELCFRISLKAMYFKFIKRKDIYHRLGELHERRRCEFCFQIR